MDSRSASMHDSASLLCDFGDPNGSASIESGEARALSGWRIKRFESSVSDCRNYYDLYATIGAYYKAEERAGRVTRKYFVSIFS